jgi:ribosomal protein L18E
VFAHISTANALIVAGNITGTGTSIGMDSASAINRVANVYSTYGDFTNLTTANARLTGGSITNITGAASTFVATNFSSGNAQIIGGSVTGITGAATTLQATNFSSANISITGGNIVLGAGTASKAPLQFSTGGSLHSTAAAGMLEYTTLFHGTTQGTERGLIPAAQYYVLNADRGLATATATQTLFNQSFKVTSNTRYHYRAFISISKANATANTLQYALVLGGTPAVLAAHMYSAQTKVVAARTTVTAMNQMSNRITTGFNTLVSISAASAAAAAVFDAHIEGVIDVTTGGTINPQIALATNTTTTPLLLAQSYWLMYPVGPISANTSIQ